MNCALSQKLVKPQCLKKVILPLQGQEGGYTKLVFHSLATAKQVLSRFNNVPAQNRKDSHVELKQYLSPLAHMKRKVISTLAKQVKTLPKPMSVRLASSDGERVHIQGHGKMSYYNMIKTMGQYLTDEAVQPILKAVPSMAKHVPWDLLLGLALL